MPRLPLARDEELSGKIATAIQRLPAGVNLFRILAHAGDVAVAQIRLGAAILSKQSLTPKNRELLILLTAAVERGCYEWNQHVAVALHAGVTQNQIDALLDHDLDDESFDGAEAALLRFGRQTIENVRVDDGTFDALKLHYSAQEIVEALLTIGFYMTIVRVTEVTRLENDRDAGLEVVASAQR
jgi:alkylhydroperoxidase family enzyme